MWLTRRQDKIKGKQEFETYQNFTWKLRKFYNVYIIGKKIYDWKHVTIFWKNIVDSIIGDVQQQTSTRKIFRSRCEKRSHKRF